MSWWDPEPLTSFERDGVPHRPAHLLLGQCSLPVTFRMVVPIFPMVRPPGSGWISCHNLHWGSTTKCTRGCEGRGGRLRLRLDSTTNSTQGFDGPRSCPATLQAPLSHIVVLPSSTHTLSGRMSASVARWVLWQFRLNGRSTDADLFKQALGDCSQARDARA